MGHVAEKAGQEARHDIQIAEDLHQLASLNEVGGEVEQTREGRELHQQIQKVQEEQS